MNKKIQITNMELLTDLAPALNQIKDIKMSGKITVRIVKTMNNIFEALRAYDSLRKASIEKYALKNDDGRFAIDTENGESVYKFQDEEAKKNAGEAAMLIANEKIDLMIFPISEEDVESIEGITVETIGRLVKWEFVETKNHTEELKQMLEEATK